jgi:hypothetical protein
MVRHVSRLVNIRSNSLNHLLNGLAPAIPATPFTEGFDSASSPFLQRSEFSLGLLKPSHLLTLITVSEALSGKRVLSGHED